MLRTLGCAFAVGFGLLAMIPRTSVAAANDYPNRIIKLIVASAPGGPTDTLARTLAAALGAELGQNLVIENRSGAGGITAYQEAATAIPDGYTLVVVDQSLAIQPSLYSHLPYDVEKDFTPISLFVRSPSVLVARKSLEASDPAELIALAKREPGKLTYASSGTGVPNHLKAEMLKTAYGVDIRHVPYRGAAPALTDIVAGRIDIMFVNVGIAKPQIDAGTIKALAVEGKQRNAKLPNVPTFYEAKLPMPQLDANTWWGVMAPANLPASIQDKLNDAIAKALKNPQLLKHFDDLSAEAQPSTPEELTDLIGAERKQWAEVAKAANIQPQ